MRVALLAVLAAMVGIVAAGPQVAHAAALPQALILGDSVSPGVAPDGSGDSLEQYEAIQDGFGTTVVTEHVGAGRDVERREQGSHRNRSDVPLCL